MTPEEYKKLTRKTVKRKQPEGALQINLGKMLKGVWRYRLNPNITYWTYSGAGERKDKKGALWQYLKGLNPGDSDYRWQIAEDGILRMVFLETKSGSGSLTADQKLFFERHKGLSNVACGIAKDMQEVEEFLVKTRVFIN